MNFWYILKIVRLVLTGTSLIVLVNNPLHILAWAAVIAVVFMWTIVQCKVRIPKGMLPKYTSERTAINAMLQEPRSPKVTQCPNAASVYLPTEGFMSGGMFCEHHAREELESRARMKKLLNSNK